MVATIPYKNILFLYNRNISIVVGNAREYLLQKLHDYLFHGKREITIS